MPLKNYLRGIYCRPKDFLYPYEDLIYIIKNNHSQVVYFQQKKKQ